MTILYGIKNCDTVRKARRWLDQHGVEHRFHDLRSDGLDRETLEGWSAQLGWERLLNRRGRTFRELPTERTAALDEARALELMLEQPTLIKRPVVAHGTSLLIGFTEAEFETLLMPAG